MVGRRAAASHRVAENRLPGARYIRSMNTPASVVGCSKCGALYTPGPGDRGVCLSCRRALPSTQPSGAPRALPSTQPAGATFKRPAGGSPLRASAVSGRAWRLIAIGVAAALLVAGVGASVPRKSLSDAWTAIRRHKVSQTWTVIRRHTSKAWIAIRRHTPFDDARRGKPKAAAKRTADSSGAGGTP
jgi:hypothetical protein